MIVNKRLLTSLLLGGVMIFSSCGKVDQYHTPPQSGQSTTTAAEAENTSTTAAKNPVTILTRTVTAASTSAGTAPRTTVTASAAPASSASPRSTARTFLRDDDAPVMLPNHTGFRSRTAAPAVLTATAPQSIERTQEEYTTLTTVTTAPPVPAERSPREVLADMTLEEKVCQMFIVTPEQLTGISPMLEVGSGTRSALMRWPVGGIVYFAQNLESREQIMNMIANTQSYSLEACGVGLFTAVDEEGGAVARCAQKLGTAAFSDMAAYGAENSYETAYSIGRAIGIDLYRLGFNVDFAPVADVNIDPANELGTRIFSGDPAVVANMVCGVSSGLQDNGVCAVLKHFPGLGAENGNTHSDSAVVIDRTVEQLKNTEFIPFRAAIKDAGASFVMVGHQTVTGFGDGLPSDLSHIAATEMLRGELGFDGIAVTDSHMMNTISGVYGADRAAVAAINAGMDMILMPADLDTAVQGVVNAVYSGEIPISRIDQSVYRILRQKKQLELF